MKKQTFALYFGNRGFMPAELIEGAREDMVKAVTDAIRAVLQRQRIYGKHGIYSFYAEALRLIRRKSIQPDFIRKVSTYGHQRLYGFHTAFGKIDVQRFGA